MLLRRGLSFLALAFLPFPRSCRAGSGIIRGRVTDAATVRRSERRGTCRGIRWSADGADGNYALVGVQCRFTDRNHRRWVTRRSVRRLTVPEAGSASRICAWQGCHNS